MSPSTPKPVSAGNRIPEFEGLRGCLAWWVVLFHLFLRAGLDRHMVGRHSPSLLVFYGWAAVPLFIILSGYVIAVLIDTQKESFSVFITRRFFRLAPVFYLLTAYATIQAIHYHLYHGTLGYHVLLHLTMLHGLVPQQVLHDAAISLVHPAWSISVEWQFYLVAPLILKYCRSSATLSLFLISACLVLSRILLRHFTFPFEATVVMRAGLFAVGIYSYYFTRFATANPRLLRPIIPSLLPLGVVALWVFRGEIFGPGIIWIIVLTPVLARLVGAEFPLTKPVQFILTQPVIIWLGKVSYSTYLCHNFVMSMVESVMGTRFQAMTPQHRVAALVLISMPLIAGFSALLYHFVEKPGMRLGKQIVSRMTAKPAEAPIGELSAV